MNVYKQYDQEQLNNQYNVRLHVPDHTAYFERWEKLSRQTEKEHTVLKNISFGTHPEERLDIFPSQKPISKTLVFIHGGYWHLLDKSLFHFIAGHLLRYDITTVLINYPLAPAASIDTIVLSCRKAIRWLHDNITEFNGNPSDLYVLGHSAGGHLALMMLVEACAGFLKGVIALSGLFRLEPVMHSYLNDILRMDNAMAIRNSPIFLQQVNLCPILLATGMHETEEFKVQSEELYGCWKPKNKNIELMNVACKNHYSILDAVVEKSSVLHAAIFRLLSGYI